MERERKIKRAKEREKKRGETGGEDEGTLPQSPLVFFPALSLALFFARAPLSERLEQAIKAQAGVVLGNPMFNFLATLVNS